MIKLNLSNPLEFGWIGTSINTNENWMHATRKLDSYELMIVTSGTLYIADEFHQYEVHENEYVLMSPCEDQHGYKTAACNLHWIHFQEQISSSTLPIIELPEHGIIPNPDRLFSLISQIHNSEKFYVDHLLSSYLLTSLLIELRDQLLSNKPVLTSTTLPQEILCQRIKNYIHWNRLSRIKVADIASYIGYSEKYISAMFSTTTGMHLKYCIELEQMEEAQSMLIHTHLSISEIAYALSYTDVHNFSRSFKRITKLSPKQFRSKFQP